MIKEIGPQPGPQEVFLSSPADVCIYGGAAGGGKTYGMLLDALHYVNVQGFGAVFFRRNYNQIFAQGGLWDTSMNLYGDITGATAQQSAGQWVFRDGAGRPVSKISFKHIERDAEVHQWQGSQICGIYFDELTHFTERIFFYMLSRNRSMCGVNPYVRASCNPDADSWVAKFISWWIDRETGYPIPERSGVIRWMARVGEKIEWADTAEEIENRFHVFPKSVTFIASTIYDNQIMLKSNPAYLENLRTLPRVERERLLNGNWKIKPAAGLYFRRGQVRHILETAPLDVAKWVRAWDLAATAEEEGSEAAYTAGVLMGARKDGTYVVADVINVRLSAGDVRQLILHTAEKDRAQYGQNVRIRLPQDPGQAGKDQAQNYVKFLAGFNVCTALESGSKETRAEPAAAQWQAGNVDVVFGDWNDFYFDQLESFPTSKFKDMVDATANAFLELANGRQPFSFRM